MKCAILISGSGSGMEALVKFQQRNSTPHQTVVVISDKVDAKGLEKANALGINTMAIELPKIDDKQQRRVAHEKLVSDAIGEVDLVILSGYMRLLTANFVDRWFGKLVNIHPSLLPDFKGAHAHRDVIASDSTISGCTVHFVDSGMDTGPIIAQRKVPRFPEDDVSALAARVKVEEHILYPKVIDAIAEGRVSLEDGRVTIDGEI